MIQLLASCHYTICECIVDVAVQGESGPAGPSGAPGTRGAPVSVITHFLCKNKLKGVFYEIHNN